MKYTKHLSFIIKNQGAPNFSQEQYQLAMNIVALESRIEGIKKTKEYLKNVNQELELLIFLEGKKITELTGNLAPEIFWKKILITY